MHSIATLFSCMDYRSFSTNGMIYTHTGSDFCAINSATALATHSPPQSRSLSLFFKVDLTCLYPRVSSFHVTRRVSNIGFDCFSRVGWSGIMPLPSSDQYLWLPFLIDPKERIRLMAWAYLVTPGGLFFLENFKFDDQRLTIDLACSRRKNPDKKAMMVSWVNSAGDLRRSF